ncbi:uncharacterized protein N7483_013137 [Penicillium malachiteum]|uniref:uncharacterized protein n=1 Tax=Penicillium malachiteum TaxID=1324776 RepID=UPI0025473A79|nr:uncharacterized protein N7483_013137 [Penicillium malachiteum]KAJ5715956.1 hypothetical protein N7483_013137 [Penicillium malachiteum]
MSEMQQDGSPDAKRRKIRKGTQSCWECKRRKVRCIFSSESAICNNCHRRRTNCVSQDLPDTPVSSAGNPVEARLGRVEKLLELAVKHVGTADIGNFSGNQEILESHLVARTVENTESLVQRQASPPRNIVTNQTHHPQARRDQCLSSLNSLRRAPGKYDEISRELIAAWPSQDVLAHICTLPSGPTLRLNCVLLRSCAINEKNVAQLPHELLQLPPPGSHPVLIARKLLMLGTFLHGIPPLKIEGLGRRGTAYLELMSCVIEKAVRLVTTNDELICSVEALECIIIESVYHNHSGNLHRAWMAVRRATAVAEMMALHRGLDSPSLKFLEPASRAVFNPDQICFHLVQSDRYLSIMLGLPPTSLDTRFASDEAMKACGPIERLERTHCVVSDHILRRSEADLDDLTKTYEHDKLLQNIASEMPSQWWLSSFTTDQNDEIKLLQDTVRFMDQLAHYHLLIRLHLPYMLRSSTDHRYDHSKLTTVNASREILTRYLSYRHSISTPFSCRGDEFLAFISVTVICIAHMDARRQAQQLAESAAGCTVFNFLAHNHPSDRGLMERTLEIIDSGAQRYADPITSKLRRIISQLLVIEASSASGTTYSTSSSRCDQGVLEPDSRLTDGGKALHIYIPYLGKINFERRAMPKPDSTILAQPGPDEGVEKSQGSSSGFGPHTSYQNNDQYNHGGQEAESLTFGQLASPVSNESPALHDGDIQFSPNDPQITDSEIIEDWDLQGIDTALFDSLFRGTDIPFYDAAETWSPWET